MPVIATGSLGMVVAFGLDSMRMLDGIDRHILQWVRNAGVDGFDNRLPGWVLWSTTAVIAYGLALIILEVPGLWRRLLLWVSTLVMVLAWAPVLGLAAHQPSIAGPLVASIWSGICALIYAHQHRMAVDESSPSLTHGKG